MLGASLLALVGLVVLLAGGHALVVGASGLARALRIQPVVIGLTVVAFGTSAPELAVGLLAALGGNGGIVFGNVVGSNLANVGLILGATALIKPLAVHDGILVREIPMTILAALAVVVLALAPGAGGLAPAYDRAAGLGLLLFFGVFLYGVTGDVVRARRGDPLLVQAADEIPAAPTARPGVHALFVVVGLTALVGGGRMLVDGAAELARGLGMGEDLIGLTVVAVGTSLPELATSVIAARRGEADLAVGNIVGSNVFNALLVLGCSATAAPVALAADAGSDLAAQLVVAAVLLPMAWTQRRISRGEGGALLLGWLAYTAWRVVPVATAG